jgi:Phage portal protein
MGLRDRIAKVIAGNELEKAPNLPAGTTTLTGQDLTNLVNQVRQTTLQSIPMPRNTWAGGAPFGAGTPLIPGAINPVDPTTGRPAPRRYEYQVAQNLQTTETRLVPFKTLRASADQIDILRRCIEVIKSKVSSMEWDIVLGNDASEKIISQSGGDHLRAMVKAREDFTEEIDRVRTFWENPDKSNGLTFTDWLTIALEEILVIDALAIWPQKTVGGDLYGLQILDGSTIKPLLDQRGMRPMPPDPAYQQILYGFPRAEFTSNSDDPSADGEFTSDDLAYLVRSRRTISVYGNSPVERALPLADIYLRRQQWIRAEYTDGVLPELMFSSDSTFGNNPDVLLAYENILNDDLAGQSEQRKRARILPSGLTPITNDTYGEKFKDTLDDFLIASICGHFGVQPTEIGYSPKGGGLGGKGFEEGKSNHSEAIAQAPLVNWISKSLTNLSYTYLGMPRELEFKLMANKRQDDEASARKTQIQVTTAGKSVNEARADAGLPLLDTPEADMPMLSNGSNVYFFSKEGLINATNGTAEEETPEAKGDNQVIPPVDQEENQQEDQTKTNLEVEAETKAFMKWAQKGKRSRDFEFKTLDPVVADALNRCAFEGDLSTARSLIKAYLS